MEQSKINDFHEHKIEWSDEKISRLWDYYSRTPPYSDVYFSKIHGRSILRRTKLPLKEPLEILDFGCGPGFIWDHLKQLGSSWRYTGLDFSNDSIQAIKRKGQGYENFVSAQLVTSLPTTLPSMSYDAIFLFEVVEHLSDEHLNGTLSEANRLLKKGGVLIITTPNEEDLKKSTRFCPDCGSVYHEWQHVRSWSESGLTSILKMHNLSLRKATALNFDNEEISVKNIAKRLISSARGVLNKNYVLPHLIAIYQKN